MHQWWNWKSRHVRSRQFVLKITSSYSYFSYKCSHPGKTEASTAIRPAWERRQNQRSVCVSALGTPWLPLPQGGKCHYLSSCASHHLHYAVFWQTWISEHTYTPSATLATVQSCFSAPHQDHVLSPGQVTYLRPSTYWFNIKYSQYYFSSIHAISGTGICIVLALTYVPSFFHLLNRQNIC